MVWISENRLASRRAGSGSGSVRCFPPGANSGVDQGGGSEGAGSLHPRSRQGRFEFEFRLRHNSVLEIRRKLSFMEINASSRVGQGAARGAVVGRTFDQFAPGFEGYECGRITSPRVSVLWWSLI